MKFRSLITLGVALLSMTLISCSSAGDDKDSDAGSPDVAEEATDTVVTNDAPPIEAKTYEGTGKLVKVEADMKRVTLDHGKIGDWMDAMTMPFPVADESMLTGLEIGKSYAFTVEVRGDDDYKITKLALVP